MLSASHESQNSGKFKLFQNQTESYKVDSTPYTIFERVDGFVDNLEVCFFFVLCVRYLLFFNVFIVTFIGYSLTLCMTCTKNCNTVVKIVLIKFEYLLFIELLVIFLLFFRCHHLRLGPGGRGADASRPAVQRDRELLLDRQRRLVGALPGLAGQREGGGGHSERAAASQPCPGLRQVLPQPHRREQPPQPLVCRSVRVKYSQEF